LALCLRDREEMKYANINRLYKYYAYNRWSLSVLNNMAFWFTKPNSLNDPFDCKIPFDNRITIADLKKFLPKYQRYIGLSRKQAENKIQQVIANGQIDRKFARIWSGVLKQANEALKNSGVFCLSECKDSILMWSHYTKNHKGFCVEFERSPDNDLGDYEKTRKVRYVSEYPIINPLDSKAYDFKFFRKAKDWKYEKEWRLLYQRGNIAIPLKIKVTAIIFGLNLTKQQKIAIKKIMPNIQYRQCTKASNQFGLEIVDI
jgi:hypothetical protein